MIIHCQKVFKPFFPDKGTFPLSEKGDGIRHKKGPEMTPAFFVLFLKTGQGTRPFVRLAFSLEFIHPAECPGFFNIISIDSSKIILHGDDMEA